MTASQQTGQTDPARGADGCFGGVLHCRVTYAGAFDAPFARLDARLNARGCFALGVHKIGVSFREMPRQRNIDVKEMPFVQDLSQWIGPPGR
ncbi:MAG: hypothetical protein AAF501_14500 [Pseudomonadota bacterium]